MDTDSLNAIVAHAREKSPFYADLYSHLPQKIDDVSQLPIVDHADFWAANQIKGNRLLTGPLSEAIVFKSGGTTGAPKFSCYTRDEWNHLAAQLGAGLVDMGLRDGHRVANLFYVGELYASFFMFQDSLTQVPVESVRLPVGGAASPKVATEILDEFSAQVMGGTPTTLCGIASHLVASNRTMPSMELVFFAGEPVFADQRRLLALAFPKAEVRPATYVSVDAALLGNPVLDDDRRLYRAPTNQMVLEIVDDHTGAPIEENGRSGRVVKTDLNRRLMPVLRYPVGDRAEWVDRDAGLFRILGRHDEGARIGPVTVYVEDMRELINEVDEAGAIIGVQLVARRWEGRDGLVLRLATHPGFTGQETLGRTVVSKLNVSRPMYRESSDAGYVHPLTVEWKSYQDLAVNDRTGKLMRVVDERPLD
jgi:phenylacetate-coenzyme A ligase PaaK-like adenylate-forming protein